MKINYQKLHQQQQDHQTILKIMKSNYLIFLFFSSFCFSQNHVIIDSITKKTIPYANIKIIGTEKGFYSNDSGVFILKDHAKDSVQISCLGYKSIFNKVSLLKDTIFLTPEVKFLSEVSIHQKPPKSVIIGLKKKNMSFHAGAHLQFGLIIKPIKEFEKSIIKKILIPISKSNFSKKRDFESVLKINIYSCEGNLPDMPLISKPIIVNCNQDSNKTLVIDIEKEDVEFDENGIFISIEMIGEIDENGIVINQKKPLPGIKYTDKGTKHFSFIKSYYKTKFSGKWEYMNPKTFQFKKEIYLAIQLELAIYED